MDMNTGGESQVEASRGMRSLLHCKKQIKVGYWNVMKPYIPPRHS